MVCSKCKGEGYLPQFDHIENGECFPCGGTGEIPERHSVLEASEVEALFRCSTYGCRPLHPEFETVFKEDYASPPLQIENLFRLLSRVSLTGELKHSCEGDLHEKLYFVECSSCRRDYPRGACSTCNGRGLLWIPRPEKIGEFLRILLRRTLTREGDLSRMGLVDDLSILDEVTSNLSRIGEKVNGLVEGLIDRSHTMTRMWHLHAALECVLVMADFEKAIQRFRDDASAIRKRHCA